MVCGEEKPLSSFGENRAAKRTMCKTCYNLKNPSKVRSAGKMEYAIKALGGCCAHCGVKYNGKNSVIFDFHHIDPSQKTAQVSQLRYGPLDKMMAEVAKCKLLCANCHRLHHYYENQVKVALN